MWLNDKLLVIVVCCLSYDVLVFGTSLRKRDVSSAYNVDKKSVKDREDESSSDWDDSYGDGDDDDIASSLGDSTNRTKNSDDDGEDLISGFDSNDDSKNGSNKTTKGSGSGDDSAAGLGSETGSKKKKGPKESDKKKKKKQDGSTYNSTKNNTSTGSNTDWISDLGTDYDSNWPNDQGWNQSSSTTNGTHFSGTNSTSGKNTTSAESLSAKNTTTASTGSTTPTNITDWLNGIIDQAEKNANHNGSSSSSTNNFTSAENATTKIPHQNITSTEKPPSSTTSTPETKYSTGYWIPIFNFGNDFYFLTNKGYAKLVNFPAPVIYSFMPVSLKTPNFNPTGGTLRQDEEEFIGNFFKNDASFAECYVNANVGNLIPYSYFGSWVAVFNLQNGWHLQTYSGFVPLDLTSEQAPVTFEFDPIKYEFPTAESFVSTTVTVQETGKHDGLATWNEPVVVED